MSVTYVHVEVSSSSKMVETSQFDWKQMHMSQRTGAPMHNDQAEALITVCVCLELHAGLTSDFANTESNAIMKHDNESKAVMQQQVIA